MEPKAYKPWWVKNHKLKDGYPDYVAVCEVHYDFMVKRVGKYGEFWSCPKRDEDGRWCQFRAQIPKKD